MSEAEDAVQETWLRYEISSGRPTSTKAFLSAVVTRISINVLRSARVRREDGAVAPLPPARGSSARPVREDNPLDTASDVAATVAVAVTFTQGGQCQYDLNPDDLRSC